MAISKEEKEARLDYIAGMECAHTMRDRVSDYSRFEDFQYAVQREELSVNGIPIGEMPMAGDASKKDYEKMDSLFCEWNSTKSRTSGSLFADCIGTREQLKKIISLNEVELLLVSGDVGMPMVLRRAAEEILHGSIDVVYKMLDQALGKPIERSEVLTADVSNLSGLSTDEIRKLLESGEEDD